MPVTREQLTERIEYAATLIGVPRCPRKSDLKRLLRDRFGVLRPDQIEAILKAARQLLQSQGAVPFTPPQRPPTTAAETLALYDGIAADTTAVLGLRNRFQRRADLLRAALVRAGARAR